MFTRLDEVPPLTDADGVGATLHRLVAELYPICRSITGEGVRTTLRRLQQSIPLELVEVPSGTPVLDWEVPPEWNLREAWIANSRGERVVDFRHHNLHVLNYSVPVRQRLTLADLRPRLHTRPDRPDWIPYRTSYYRETWGFCLTHRQLESLPEGEYEVCIDSTLAPGHLTYGECVLPGQTPDEVLLSCHCCHPSLANDNCSGLAVATALAGRLRGLKLRYTYRFLFVPGTIGSITWLARNRERVERIRHGLVLSCLGDRGGMTYKKSRRGDAEVDRAAAHVLKHTGAAHAILDFVPYGYDERQYCSPGFNLPVGCLTRTPNGRFPEYHTSADNLDLVRPEALADSLARLLDIVRVLEANRVYVNQSPYGEPRLGPRGLYAPTGGEKGAVFDEMTLLWVLNFSDGRHDLLAIADRAGLPFEKITAAARALVSAGLLA